MPNAITDKTTFEGRPPCPVALWLHHSAAAHSAGCVSAAAAAAAPPSAMARLAEIISSWGHMIVPKLRRRRRPRSWRLSRPWRRWGSPFQLGGSRRLGPLHSAVSAVAAAASPPSAMAPSPSAAVASSVSPSPSPSPPAAAGAAAAPPPCMAAMPAATAGTESSVRTRQFSSQKSVHRPEHANVRVFIPAPAYHQ